MIWSLFNLILIHCIRLKAFEFYLFVYLCIFYSFNYLLFIYLFINKIDSIGLTYSFKICFD